MVKRNDPCPCGSGKKYKKCHGRTESGTHLLAEQELKRIMGEYIGSTPAPGPDRAELSLLVKTWMSRLGGLMKAGAIEGAAYEHFAFNIRRDLWQQHLERSSANVRDEVKRVLKSWNEPFVMFAELTGKEEGYLILKDVFGDGEWAMTENERIAAPEGTLLFGTVLSDPRVREDAIQPVSTLYSISSENAAVADRIREFAASLGDKADEAFLESNLLEIFAILHTPAEEAAKQQDDGMLEEQAEHSSEADQAAREAAAGTEVPVDDEPQSGKGDEIEDLTDGQRGTIDMLISEMESDRLDRTNAENLKNVMIRYFREENPIVRKPGGIVAGIYLAAQEKNLLPGKPFTSKEMAKRFGVSEGTAQKYAAAFSGRLK
ncbi:SEC-C domain-containing protein [Bhargavaea cecembensis]|uniref:SEC-C domain-containing protein n=1 Tax=Bhargavaea cecembensis TaxID=394098 RepID=UPI000B2E4C9D|nr:SEC-C domain-containing protein [Bhargavaea cecembensis]